MQLQDSQNISALKQWLKHHRGTFHPHAKFVEGPSGFNVIAEEDVPIDATIVSCPFDLAVSETSAQKALSDLLDLSGTQSWSEHQWICTYICMHWVLGEESVPPSLQHFPYLNTLPKSQQLLTPLHFTVVELESFRGSNIYGATLDRQTQWQSEWSQCRGIVGKTNKKWESSFTWESYLTAATYVSSRAFPSSLLSPNPTLTPSPSTGPVLLPGVDSLNHARAQPVSWVVTHPTIPGVEASVQRPTISLVLHTPTPAGRELLNNYGPKPNSELILGYGFSIPNNPDDTILLKVGGVEGKRWEIGREARGAEDLWNYIVQSMAQESGSQPSYEDLLDASGMLTDMVQNLLDRLPKLVSSANSNIREEVVVMFENYIEGQRDILYSLMQLAQEKETLAIDMAKSQGIDIVLEDE